MSLVGTLPQKFGSDGRSAYQVALDNGFKGTEKEWLESLVGKQGKTGNPGRKGDTGEVSLVYAHQHFAQTIKETASGTQIEITDGADAPFVGLKVYGNESPSSNLINYPNDYNYVYSAILNGNTTGTYNGVDITLNDDGSITVNGTATDLVDLMLIPNLDYIDYVGDVNPEEQSFTLVYDIGLSDESARDKIMFCSRVMTELKQPFLMTFQDVMESGGYDEFGIALKTEETFNNLTIYPQINKDSLKPWQPCGQQILTNKPITVTMSNGTETKDVVIPIDALYGYGVYESEDSSDSGARDYIDFERKKLVKYYNYEYVLSSLDSRIESSIFNAGFNYADAESNGVNIQQCVLTNNPMYKRAEHPDSIWGTPNGVQYLNMWADQYFWIQNTDWEYKSLSEINAELAANPLVFVFPTTEPIEYDLTDEQIEAFEQMKTFYGNTTISTDCGAIMDVEYVADTKLYIDKKFEELKQ